MADKPLPWFRAYHESAFDPKFDIASTQTGLHHLIVFGAWWKLLCLAGSSPVRGTLSITSNKGLDLTSLSKLLSLDEKECDKVLKAFIDLEMLEMSKGKIYSIKNWDKRQFGSDDSSSRVKRYRDNRKKNGMKAGNGYDHDMVCNRDSNACVYCGVTSNLVVDHILPISKGGTDDIDNLVCACKKCNSGKAGRTPEEAGYAFINENARGRYVTYMSRRVTVTVTPPDSDTDSDTDIEEEEDGQPIVYGLFSKKICKLTPTAKDGLDKAIETYGQPAVIEAIEMSADNRARSWKYVEKVLGNQSEPTSKKSSKAPEPAGYAAIKEWKRRNGSQV